MSRSFAVSAVLYLLLSGLDGCKKNYRVMSWTEYSQHSSTYKWPYILNIYNTGGGLLYFGAKHSNKPEDEQFVEIEALWKQFQPDIAFNEGGNPTVQKTRNEAITRSGEPGLVRYLAARDKVPVRSIDPTEAEETTALRKKFSPEQIKLFFILLQTTEYGRIIQPPDPLEEHQRKIIEFLNSVPGLDVAPRSVSELQSAFVRNFPDLKDYKNASPKWFDPTLTDTVFNDISRYASDYRDKYMVELLSRAVCSGKRVFAVVGATHVVMQEPAIRRSISESCPR